MSGVIVKMGIYGIIRFALMLKNDLTLIGESLLILSVLTGIFGILNSAVHRDLKKMLAYCTIENIGIIGIGIALMLIGMGMNNPVLIVLGLSGALLHVLNHSLFKSLLFFAAGSVYQQTHTRDMEKLGGLVNKMPQTTILFLAASLAICGLPPFNGFISEFLIYSGLFKSLENTLLLNILLTLFSILGLVIIGGLAMLCFTKAFGAVFLGNPRHRFNNAPIEANIGKLIPMYMIVTLIVSIGIFPNFFLQLLSAPIKLFSAKIQNSPAVFDPVTTNTIQYIGWSAVGFILLSGFVFFIRKKMTGNKAIAIQPTWGCAYVGNTEKMQYTASSFIRSYRKLAEPLLSVQKKKQEVKGVFPSGGLHETHPHDKIEELLIKNPLKQLRFFFSKFRFLQNGNPQFYVLYGVAFIILILGVPFLYEAAKKVIEFINKI